MSSGGKGSGRRKTATSAHAPSRPPLKHSSKQGSLTSQHLDPAAGHASKESFIGQSDAMQFENQPGIQIQTSPLIQEQQHAWDQDVDYSYARNQIRAEGDEEAMDEGEAEGEGGGGEITHEDDLDVDDQRGNDDGIFHQPGEAKENYEEEEGEGEGEEEEMTDPDGSDEGEMEAIEGGEEGQEGEGELEGEGGAQEGQGGPVAVVAPELTDTVRMGILAAEARRDNIFEKIEVLCKSGLAEIDEMRVKFLVEVATLKSDTGAQTERVCQDWREISLETRAAEVRLMNVRKLVEVLGANAGL